MVKTNNDCIRFLGRFGKYGFEEDKAVYVIDLYYKFILQYLTTDLTTLPAKSCRGLDSTNSIIQKMSENIIANFIFMLDLQCVLKVRQ